MFNLRNLAAVALAFILGFIGLGLVFSDLSARESALSRIMLAAIFFLLCGGSLGYFNPRGWPVSVFSAWGAILFGAIMTLAAIRTYGSNAFAAQAPPYISAGLVILLIPASLALLGGYLGKRLRRKCAAPAA